MKKNKLLISDATKIKKIINLTINILEENINLLTENQITNDKNKELLHFLIGNKDNVVSIITKLTNILIKMGSIENLNLDENKLNVNVEGEDIKIIKQYITKYGLAIDRDTRCS